MDQSCCPNKMVNYLKPIAHFRSSDNTSQHLDDHLLEVSKLSAGFASQLRLEVAGELIGLVHDIGKYSLAFQVYLKSAVGLLNQDADEEYVDAGTLKGTIDHSTAGAQLIWQTLQNGQLQQIVGQMLSLCVASHHSGLIDCISGNDNNFGIDTFSKRMEKVDQLTHITEAMSRLPNSISSQVERLLKDSNLISSLQKRISAIMKSCGQKDDKSVRVQNHVSLLVRFLFSCLIDADRLNSAEFDKPYLKTIRENRKPPSWDELATRLESHLNSFERRFDIDEIRERISSQCLQRATEKTGVFSLSVPTGGGKTLASLRFALHHAKHNKLDRVFYIVPFTSIIDQNAEAVREILHRESDGQTVVLEHHSNLTPEKQGWQEKLLTENWDAPIIFTTMVQFLESLFGSGTRGARRMHQLANSVVIFDEVQALPIKCVHLFNNAVNFLVEQCNSTAVMCTATQPLLHRVDEKKGSLRLPPENELMPDIQDLFNELKRVEVLDRQKPGGWTTEEVSKLTIAETKRTRSCLVVVNTKKSARKLFEATKADDFRKFHLSTNMCPRHRKDVFAEIRDRLTPKSDQRTICFSTQLIEAGVDLDFGSVIRYCAGLDSIAQAAGRCNRNAQQDQGTVHVINPADENLGQLKEIQVGIEKSNRVLQDFREAPGDYDNDLIGPKALEWFYENYFHQRASEMSFPVSARDIGHDDTLLNLLSLNQQAVGQYQQREKKCPDIYFRQAFMTAAKAFKAIDAPTRGIIVPFGKEGRQLIGELCSDLESTEFFTLLRRAQQFTVNVFPNTLDALTKEQAVRQIREDTDILYLTDERYYHPEFGLVTEPLGSMEFLDA